jgi:hypothetical protein
MIKYIFILASICQSLRVPFYVNPVGLGTTTNFAILSKAGISSISSTITGDIGVSPIAATAMTGLSLSLDSSGCFSKSSQIVGKAYASNYQVPSPSYMTTAIYDLTSAYNEAAGRSVSSEFHLNVKAGLISGEIFESGVYEWGTNVNFSSDISIKGNKTDVFIFKISGALIVGSGAKIIIIGKNGSEPLASNIIWQISKYVSAGTTSHTEGTFLVATHAVFKTGSSLNGRVLSQTAVTLDHSIITK